MFMRKIGHPLICYEGAGEGAGGGASETGGAGQGAVAPWAAHTGDGPWSIGDKPWYSLVPEAPVAELIGQKAYKTPAELATAYYNLNKITSTEDARKIIVPGNEAKPEEWDNIFTKLGRPANPEGYNEALKFDENVKVDPTTLEWGKKLGHQLGLNPKQMRMMADEHNKFVGEQATKMAEKQRTDNDAAVAEVKAKWGAEADAMVAAGQRVYQALGLDEALSAKLEASIGSAAVVELLARIGKASGEGGFTAGGAGGGGQNGNPNAMTPEAAAAEITRLAGDEEFQKKYTDKTHPEFKASLERMNQLYARAGDKAPG